MMAWPTDKTGQWPVIRYQPILFLFLWIGTFHVVLPGGGNASINALGGIAWVIWLVTGFACPPLLLLSWWLIDKQQGRWRYRGMWIRLSADMGELGVIFTFLWARLLSNDPPNDARVYGWIAITSMAVFMVFLVGRDIVMLSTVEHIAAEERHDQAEHHGRD